MRTCFWCYFAILFSNQKSCDPSSTSGVSALEAQCAVPSAGSSLPLQQMAQRELLLTVAVKGVLLPSASVLLGWFRKTGFGVK